MKKNIILVVVGLLIGSASYWTFRDGPLATAVRENALVQKATGAFDERATDRMQAEMEKYGKIVTTKRADENIMTVTDLKLNDLVKATLAIDPDLTTAMITTEVKSGEVTLRGTASTYNQVGRAIRLSLGCGPTKSVVSMIQVK
jgi:hypothetical protein